MLVQKVSIALFGLFLSAFSVSSAAANTTYTYSGTVFSGSGSTGSGCSLPLDCTPFSITGQIKLRHPLAPDMTTHILEYAYDPDEPDYPGHPNWQLNTAQGFLSTSFSNSFNTFDVSGRGPFAGLLSASIELTTDAEANITYWIVEFFLNSTSLANNYDISLQNRAGRTPQNRSTISNGFDFPFEALSTDKGSWTVSAVPVPAGFALLASAAGLAALGSMFRRRRTPQSA